MLSKIDIAALSKITSTHIPDEKLLDAADKDKARIANEHRLRLAVNQWFYKHYFNFLYAPKGILEVNDDEPSLSLLQSAKLNEMLLRATGIGENNFFLNESFGDDESILDFEKLSDYDKDQHEFQETMRLKHSKEVNFPDEYYPRLNSVWARALLSHNGQRQFFYLIINSAAFRILHTLEELGSTLLEELIPHHYSHHTEKVDNDKQYHITIDANGHEECFDSLRTYMYSLLQSHFKSANEEFEKRNDDCIWTETDTSTPGDPYVIYTFSNSSALNVRFSKWEKDTLSKLNSDHSILNEIVKQHEKDFELKLRQFHSSLY